MESDTGGAPGGMGMTSEPTSEPTSSPTIQPTPEPTTTVKPTPAPTRRPTTRKPTRQPSPEPTTEPSIGSTAEPTLTPTTSPTYTPTLSPSSRPTSTFSPTSMEPTLSASVVPLPVLQFTVQFIPKTTIDVFEVESLVETFLRTSFSKDAAYKSNFVSLLVTSNTEYDRETGIAVISSGGSAVFRGRDQPSDADVSEILITYFSFWGASDLQTDIGEGGYPVLDVRVKIDGVRVKSSKENPPTSAPVTESSTATSFTPGLIGGVAAAGALCVFAAIAVYIEHGRRRRIRLASGDKQVEIGNSHISSDEEDSSEAPSPRISNRSRKVATPRVYSAAPLPPPSDDLEDISLSGMLSMDDSMFISESGQSPSVMSERSYDLSRLDMIISSAKAQYWSPDDEEPQTPKQSNIGRRQNSD
ncbi:hypothetical protein MPSEU_000907900 [Mayamaea pseudoterrestris]|nr:hypothetical protein MPSEU_000907900 [Mayamaea pseudoterrestris]